MEKEQWLKKIEKMHPYQTLVYLGMFGSGLLFLFMTLSFLITRSVQADPLPFENFTIPKSFIASTLILLISGRVVSRITYQYKNDHTHKLKQSLAVTFILGLAFTTLQFLGWGELREMGVDFRGLPSGSFLYVLSGIHIFHLLGALTFALFLFVHVHQNEKDEVRNLLFLANHFEKMRFQLFSHYWLFMDIIWLLLFSTILVAF